MIEQPSGGLSLISVDYLPGARVRLRGLEHEAVIEAVLFQRGLWPEYRVSWFHDGVAHTLWTDADMMEPYETEVKA